MIVGNRIGRVLSHEDTAGYRLKWWLALPSAAVGGLMLDLASPGLGIWPLAIPGVMLILLAWWQQRVGVALLAGLVAGAAFWMPQISWLTLYLGPIPWLALSAVMIAWFVVQGAATACATRGIGALMRGRGAGAAALISLQALAAAGIWVLREGVQGSWPYGGFAWGRLAHLFASSPVGSLVSWLGFAGLSALIVAVCAVFIGWSFSRVKFVAEAQGRSIRTQVSSRSVMSATLVGLLVAVALGSVPPALLETTGSLRVAAIQGNSKAGIFDDREAGDVYRGYVDETEQLLDELEATDDAVDVIVWPENSAEFGLTDNPLRSREVALLSARADAPIVLGAVLANEDGTYTNSALVWGADGQAEPRDDTRYDKRFPVPFAEYMPSREFFHALVPDLVDLVQLEYEAGVLPPVLPVPTSGGEVLAGVAICFDIIFDDQAVQMVGDGAQVIFAQTNNADFGRTDESVQQLQIARLRAIETGRPLVNISTVGTSRVVAPDGTDIAALEPFTAGAMVADVPLVSGATPAIAYGALISGAWMWIGVASIIAGAFGCVAARRRF